MEALITLNSPPVVSFNQGPASRWASALHYALTRADLTHAEPKTR